MPAVAETASCPGCLLKVRYSTGYAGRRIRCRCGTVSVLPDAGPVLVDLYAKRRANVRPVVTTTTRPEPAQPNPVVRFLRVWPGTWCEKPAKMLKADLKRAGIPYRVETRDGPRYLDFHALRHSFVSSLAAAGVGPKELQTLARHSDPHLTLSVYTHAGTDALAAVVDRLQLPGGKTNPLAGMSRAELEEAVVGLLGVVGVLLGQGIGFSLEKMKSRTAA